jgi:hypothetical protein
MRWEAPSTGARGWPVDGSIHRAFDKALFLLQLDQYFERSSQGLMYVKVNLSQVFLFIPWKTSPKNEAYYSSMSSTGSKI